MSQQQITAKDLRYWYGAQELVYASRTRGDFSIRLTVSKFSDFPLYTVTRRHINTLALEDLYYGTGIDAAVRIFNEEN